MPRGYHSRRWVKCWDLDGCGIDKYPVEHEEPSNVHYGVFSVIYCDYRERFYVVWRANRNATRDTKVMRESGPERHVWYNEEVRYTTLEEAVASIPFWRAQYVPPEKPKRRLRDSQKGKVYRWEHKMAEDIGPTEPNEDFREGQPERVRILNVLERRRSENYLRLALDHICINLGVDTPDLKFRSGGSTSTGSRWRIRLLPCHRTMLVLLHELAHVLHYRWDKGKGEQGHGKEFMGIYAYLLIRFGGVNKDNLVRHAIRAGVKLELPDQYWTWADEAIPVETDEDFAQRVKAA